MVIIFPSQDSSCGSIRAEICLYYKHVGLVPVFSTEFYEFRFFEILQIWVEKVPKIRVPCQLSWPRTELLKLIKTVVLNE